MANSNIIVLEADETPLVASTKRANEALDSQGDHAEKSYQRSSRAAEEFSKTNISITDRTLNAQKRMVDNFERRWSALGKNNPLDKLESDKSILIQRLSGNDAYIADVKRIFADRRSVIQKEQAATQKAIRDTEIASIQRRVQSPAQRLQSDREASVKRLIDAGASKAEIEFVNGAFRKLEEEAARSTSSIGEKVKQFLQDPLNSAGNAAASALEKFGKFGVIAGAALLGLGVAAKGTFDAFREAGRHAEEIVKLGDRLGVTAGQAAILNAQARIAGVAVDSFSGLVRKLSTTLADGTDESRQTVQALESIGVKVGAAGGKFRDPIVILREFSKQLAVLPDHASQVDLLSRAFGRGAVELLPLIKNFEDLERQAKATGVGLDDDLLKRMAAVDDKMDALGISWDRLRLKFSEKIVAVLEVVTNMKDAEFSDKLASILTERFKTLSSEQSKLLLEAADKSGYLAAAKFDEFQKVIEEKQAKEINVATRQFAAPINIEANVKIKPLIDLDTSKIKTGVQSLVDTSKVILGREADRLVDEFRSRVNLKGLQQQLAALEERRNKAEARVVKGPETSADDIRSSIALVSSIEKQITAKKEQIKIFQEFPNAIKDAQAYATAAARQEVEGVAKVTAEVRAKEQAYKDAGYSAGQLAKLNAIVDQGGTRQLQIEARKELLKLAKEDYAVIVKEGQDRLAFEEKILQKRLALADETSRIRQATAESALGFDSTIAEQDRDRQLRALDSIQGITLQQKIAIEARKSQIEQDYIGKRQQIELDAIQRSSDNEIAILRGQRNTDIDHWIDYDQRIFALMYDSAERQRQIRVKANDEALRAQEEAAIKSAKLIEDQNRSIFDRFKRQSEGIFDAMLTRGQNAFQALGNSFKNIFLTAIKDVISSRVAATLTHLFTGEAVTLKPGSAAAGPLGKLGQILGLGAVPVFGKHGQGTTKLDLPGHLGDTVLHNGSVRVWIMNPTPQAKERIIQQISGGPAALVGGTAAAGAAAVLGALAGSVPKAIPTGAVSSTIDFGSGPLSTGAPAIFGGSNTSSMLGPGGTSGFAGPLGGVFDSIRGVGAPITTPPFIGGSANQIPGTTKPGGFGGLLGSFKGSLVGLKDFFGFGGGVQYGPGQATTWGASTLGQKFSALGRSNAALLGGGMLAMDGLRRGGLAGLGETTLGGAMIGFKFGGPIGAAIGAGIGAVAGGIRMLFKSGTEKLREKIKATYQVDISDKSTLQQILGIAKQNYGGDLDMAIRSQPVRDLIELYALAHGQNAKGIVDRAQASIFSNSGGKLSASPTYFNGQAVMPGDTNSRVGIPSLTPNGGYSQPQGANVFHGTIQLDKEATEAILTGTAARYVNGNPRAISQAASVGMDASSARRQISSQVLRPNFVAS